MTEGEATAERPPSDLVRIVLEAFDTSIEDVDLGVRGEGRSFVSYVPMPFRKGGSST